jgi:phosphatidylserine/phosphatidylglycerophosphate/cardiolipin synthase-like enzyme
VSADRFVDPIRRSQGRPVSPAPAGPPIAGASGLQKCRARPKEKRKADAAAKLGILHVKWVVGDARWLFLSSTNLTKYACSLTVELGVLITGGQAPQKIESIFNGLIDNSVFVEVASMPKLAM